MAEQAVLAQKTLRERRHRLRRLRMRDTGNAALPDRGGTRQQRPAAKKENGKRPMPESSDLPLNIMRWPNKLSALEHVVLPYVVLA